MTFNEKDELKMKQCRIATGKLYHRKFFPTGKSSINFAPLESKTLGFGAAASNG